MQHTYFKQIVYKTEHKFTTRRLKINKKQCKIELQCARDDFRVFTVWLLRIYDSSSVRSSFICVSLSTYIVIFQQWLIDIDYKNK